MRVLYSASDPLYVSWCVCFPQCFLSFGSETENLPEVCLVFAVLVEQQPINAQVFVVFQKLQTRYVKDPKP